MSLEDPFFVVKGEVQKAVNAARGLYQRWCQLLQETQVISKEEFDWTTNELRNSLRSIDWDLEDLEETIYILLKLGLEQRMGGGPSPGNYVASFFKRTVCCSDGSSRQ
ncbi:syntaxin-10 isoform X2 [Podarcis lilfordi]|uniref:Syntaxin-10 isoform X2 n=1 Tax=Podarcis lilfordi TaxID=74358 RepID=A0AA35JW47_9SAUR|nr:syntaxin-10 isoform X2 [Podarcis lilfordi]